MTSGEYLTFRLGAEEYGIDILQVQEIRSYEQPTRLENVPAFLKGVIGLRGVMVPIIDLRIALGCEQVEYNHFTVVVVLNIHERIIGAVVDSVSDVLEVKSGQIQAAPSCDNELLSRFVTGLAHVHERMLIFLDVEGLLGSPEMGLVDFPQ